MIEISKLPKLCFWKKISIFYSYFDTIDGFGQWEIERRCEKTPRMTYLYYGKVGIWIEVHVVFIWFPPYCIFTSLDHKDYIHCFKRSWYWIGSKWWKSVSDTFYLFQWSRTSINMIMWLKKHPASHFWGVCVVLTRWPYLRSSWWKMIFGLQSLRICRFTIFM